jgi:hypothetical protein
MKIKVTIKRGESKINSEDFIFFALLGGSTQRHRDTEFILFLLNFGRATQMYRDTEDFLLRSLHGDAENRDFSLK